MGTFAKPCQISPMGTKTGRTDSQSPEIVSSSDTKITLRLPSRMTSPNPSSDIDLDSSLIKQISPKTQSANTSLPPSTTGSLVNEPVMKKKITLNPRNTRRILRSTPTQEIEKNLESLK